jgi:hemolysin activation/secretion protein
VSARAEREIVRSLRVGGGAGLQHVTFGGLDESFVQAGADVTFDTRLDPVLPRNAVYARASLERLAFSSGGTAVRTDLEARADVGLVGQSVVELGIRRRASDTPLPAYLKPMLGGQDSLRGFRAGAAIGDTVVNASAELRVPLSSPLSLGRMGVSAFVDAGAAGTAERPISTRRLDKGYGGGVWWSLTALRLSVEVAHGVGAGTRLHVAGGLTF